MNNDRGTSYSQSPSSVPTNSPAIPRTPLSSTGSVDMPRSQTLRGELSDATPMPFMPSPSPYSTPGTSSDIRSSPDSQSTPGYATENMSQTIWNTNISTTDLYNVFLDFLTHFKKSENEDDEPYYVVKLSEVVQNNESSLDIDCQDLYSHPETEHFYTCLCAYPNELLQLSDIAVNEYLHSTHPDYDQSLRIQTRFYNLKETKTMRELGPDHILQLISLRGMITRVGEIIPDMKQATFQCSICKSYQIVNRIETRIEEPVECPHCHKKGTFQLEHNLCYFSDKQLIKIQETPNMIPEGETPQNVTLYCYDDNIDKVKPGDRVEITGIFRAVPVRVRPAIRTVRSIFKTYIDVIHFKQLQRSEINDKEDAIDYERDRLEVERERQEHIAQMKAMGADPNIYTKLVQSIAPSIWGMEDIKKGILCMLFGGTPMNVSAKDIESMNSQDPEEGVPHKTEQHFRSEVNILLCGDPGTSKSQLLSYVNKIAPRGIYTSGKGSSAVGLTAYVTKDSDTGELILESGALVLSDKGVCCIDEFDKMDDSTRAILHEAMEQQTISIAKAGIICSLNSRTSILAAANPVNSRYDPKLSILQNLLLPASLLSRFDLIYLILDQVNKETDRKLAKHIISLFTENSSETLAQTPYDMKTLTSFIAYAKENCFPQITEETANVLRDAYLDLRKLPNGAVSKKIITATPRQLESLIRLSEALAKMRLSDTVEPRDVEEAHRLINVSSQRFAMDPTTGILNMERTTIN